MNDPMYEPSPTDSPYVLELKAKARDLAEQRQRLTPSPAQASFNDQHFALQNYAVSGAGSTVQPDGSITSGSYEAAGIVEHEQIEFSRLMHLQPAVARQLLDVVKAVADQPEHAGNTTGYTNNAQSLFEAEQRRITHIMAAKAALEAVPGAYAQRLVKLADRLPKAVLDLVLMTANVKTRAATERPK
jgi:hypothetical protein